MQDILIIKLGATGDVVRTTPLLRRLWGNVTWVTSAQNRVLLEGIPDCDTKLRVVSWEERGHLAGASHDLAINLEDDAEAAAFLGTVHCHRLFGAFASATGGMSYSADAHRWFDLSLISVHGCQKADFLKLKNRHTY
jgi:ADP-heptose:LPS heptosyltransferase